MLLFLPEVSCYYWSIAEECSPTGAWKFHVSICSHWFLVSIYWSSLICYRGGFAGWLLLCLDSHVVITKLQHNIVCCRFEVVYTKGVSFISNLSSAVLTGCHGGCSLCDKASAFCWEMKQERNVLQTYVRSPLRIHWRNIQALRNP
jgi:hypothetical protein